jgi:hypothetical protein
MFQSPKADQMATLHVISAGSSYIRFLTLRCQVNSCSDRNYWSLSKHSTAACIEDQWVFHTPQLGGTQLDNLPVSLQLAKSHFLPWFRPTSRWMWWFSEFRVLNYQTRQIMINYKGRKLRWRQLTKLKTMYLNGSLIADITKWEVKVFEEISKLKECHHPKSYLSIVCATQPFVRYQTCQGLLFGC